MEDVMENEVEVRPKKRLVRKRRTDLALEVALRESQAAIERGADASVLNLIRARLMILNHRLLREENGKSKKTAAELERLRAENERLKVDLAQALGGADPIAGAVTTEINDALAKYRGREKGGNDAV
jgi:cell shape-determining protein MreC